MGYSTPLISGRSLGFVAVNIFFILSGYLISKSWARDSNLWRYIARRSFRVFPALFVVVVLTVFVLGPLTTSLDIRDYFSQSDTWNYLRMIVLYPVHDGLPGVFSSMPFTSSVNGSLWTLRYEFAMYLALPAVLLIGRKLGSEKRLAVVCFTAMFSLHIATSLSLISCSDLIVDGSRLAAYFFVGVLVFEYDLQDKLNIQWAAIAVFLLLIFHDENTVLSPLIHMVVTLVFTVAFSFAPNPIFGKVFQKNDYSYGVYIYAFPIQQSLIMTVGASYGFSPLVMSFLSFAVTLVFAFASWHIVEKHALSLCRKIVSRQ